MLGNIRAEKPMNSVPSILTEGTRTESWNAGRPNGLDSGQGA